MNATGCLAKIILILCLAAPVVADAAVASNPDLAIGKSANPTNAFVDNTMVFTIGLTNLGLNTASGVTGSDVVPSGLSIFEWNGSGSPSVPVYKPVSLFTPLSSGAGLKNSDGTPLGAA